MEQVHVPLSAPSTPHPPRHAALLRVKTRCLTQPDSQDQHLCYPAKPGKPGKVMKRQESGEAQAATQQKASFQPLPLVLQLLDRCSLYSSIARMTSNREA